MDDLERLFRRLVRNMRADYPMYLTSAFPVAELYQSIVPYRHNRSDLEMQVHDDYEHALTRLLAGERGYVSGEPAMQQGLAAALAGDGGGALTYRTFAASLIEISADAIRRIDAEAARTPGRSTPTVSPAVRHASTTPVPILARGPCLFCGGDLPSDRRITFCPHCGQNVTVKLCPACSADLDVGWKFCPTCGRGVEHDDDHPALIAAASA